MNQRGNTECIVSTDGGRYDININERLRYAIYWEEEPIRVQRCSWFYKREGDNRYVPYDEELSLKLEVGTNLSKINPAYFLSCSFALYVFLLIALMT